MCRVPQLNICQFVWANTDPEEQFSADRPPRESLREWEKTDAGCDGLAANHMIAWQNLL
jgi:hypothetical protein